jgi:iron complex outermembrane receptor protein
MHTFCFKLTPFALAAFLAVTTSAYGQDSQREVVPADAAKSIPTVTINASADASAEGLSKAYSGGQVARGGHLGLLGNVDAMSTPFNTTNYTQQLIQDSRRVVWPTCYRMIRRCVLRAVSVIFRSST